MTSIKTSDLRSSDSNLFVDCESFSDELNKSDLEELSESDLATINGGWSIIIPFIPPLIELGVTIYEAVKDSKRPRC